MGNNSSSSTLPGSFVPFSKTTVGSAPKKPLVTAFHSSSQWKLHFDNSKETNKLMVIDFTATWCGPCKRMEPVINEFAAQFTDVEFVKIDVDELPDVAQYFEVQAMPTFVLVKNGNVIEKVVGADKDVLQNKILKHRWLMILQNCPTAWKFNVERRFDVNFHEKSTNKLLDIGCS